MKKVTIFIIVSVSVIFWYSCKKEKKENYLKQNFIESSKLVSTFSTLEEIDALLEWISRGLPQAVKGTSDALYQNHLINKLRNISSTSDLENTFSTTNKSSVKNFNDINFPGNIYNADDYFGFVYQFCQYDITIQLNEAVTFSTSKLHVIIPDANDPDIDEDYGYFVNSLNKLDSIIIDEDNMDNYNLWIVSTSSKCIRTDTLVAPSCGNGVCDPFYGETPENCLDCINSKQPNTGRYTLELIEIHSWGDRKKYTTTHPENRYQETFINKHYEIGFEFRIGDANNSSGQKLKGDKHNFTQFYRNDVRRCRKKRRGEVCKGFNSAQARNDILDYDFDPNTDYLSFILWEDDHKDLRKRTVVGLNAYGDDMRCVTHPKNEIYTHSSSGNAHTVPPGISNWTLTPNGDYIYQTFLDGEMVLTFRLTLNI